MHSTMYTQYIFTLLYNDAQLDQKPLRYLRVLRFLRMTSTRSSISNPFDTSGSFDSSG